MVKIFFKKLFLSHYYYGKVKLKNNFQYYVIKNDSFFSDV